MPESLVEFQLKLGIGLSSREACCQIDLPIGAAVENAVERIVVAGGNGVVFVVMARALTVSPMTPRLMTSIRSSIMS